MKKQPPIVIPQEWLETLVKQAKFVSEKNTDIFSAQGMAYLLGYIQSAETLLINRRG